MGVHRKLYPAFGCEITAEEAAEICAVSIHTLKGRLWKCGNDMEETLKYYDRRYGGVIEKMKDAKEQAVAEIMDALGMQEEPTEETEAEDAVGTPDVPPRDGGAGAADTWEIEPAKPDRRKLKLLNDAVEALEKLTESEICVQSGTWDRMQDLLDRLKEERVDGFEELVDWRALETCEASSSSAVNLPNPSELSNSVPSGQTLPFGKVSFAGIF